MTLALGLDIDGVLLPLKNQRTDSLYYVRAALMASVQGSKVCVITSAQDPEDRFRRIHDIGWHPHAEYRISRSRPWDKARLLREFADREGCTTAELWDDETFYVQYAYLYGCDAMLVVDGKPTRYTEKPESVWSPNGPVSTSLSTETIKHLLESV